MNIIPFDWYKARKMDRVYMVDKQSEGYRIVDHFFVQPGTRKVQYEDAEYTLGDGHINEHHNYSYFIDKEDGNTITFEENQGPVLAPAEEDLYLNRGIMQQFAEAFVPSFEGNTLMVLLALGMGLGLGTVIGIIVHSEFLIGGF